MELGLLAKYGINGDLVLTPGSTRQIQALVGNSVHFAQVDAVTTVNAIAQGADLVMISGSLNTFPFSFVAQKEIRKPDDLSGKKVGIVGFGGANELAILLALKEWNVQRQAVTLLQAGGASQRLVAMSAKALDATVLAQPELGEAQRMGMNVLVHMRDMKAAAFPMNAIVVRRSFLQQNRDVVKRFQEAYAEATYQLLNHKDKATAVLAKWLQQKNPKAIEETYQYIATSFSFPTRIAAQGLRNTLGYGRAAKSEDRYESLPNTSMKARSTNSKKKGSSSASRESDSRVFRGSNGSMFNVGSTTFNLNERRFSCQLKFNTLRSSVKTLCEKRNSMRPSSA